jgi:hypothetical protein
MSAREFEARLLQRCALAARSDDALVEPQDACEANVFRVAAMILGPRWAQESRRLLQASERYFNQYPEQLLEPSEVVRKGWIASFPRLQDRLRRQLQTDHIGAGGGASFKVPGGA